MTQARAEIIIVGGGIGGLFAARALIAHGIEVSVYEQAPSLGEVGAGVFLTQLALKWPDGRGIGIDMNADAIAEAKEQARVDGVADRVQFFAVDSAKNVSWTLPATAFKEWKRSEVEPRTGLTEHRSVVVQPLPSIGRGD